MYKNTKIGVVVPAYNEGIFISDVISGVPEYVDSIYIVDDASQDNTYAIALKMATIQQGRVRIIQHKKNSGVGKAIASGYKACLSDNMDISVVMAGDNQMSPLQLTKLLDLIVEGQAEYAVGDRISKLSNMKSMSYWRRIGNWILTWLTRIAAGNTGIRDPQNGYTAIAFDALNRLDLDNLYPKYGYCNDILIKLSVFGYSIRYVNMPAIYRNEKSGIRYHVYIPSLSWLLFKGFIWTMRYKLFNRAEICVL